MICDYCEYKQQNGTVQRITKKRITFTQCYACEHEKVNCELTKQKMKYRTETLCRYFKGKEENLGCKTLYTNENGELEPNKRLMSELYYQKFQRILKERSKELI